MDKCILHLGASIRTIIFCTWEYLKGQSYFAFGSIYKDNHILHLGASIRTIIFCTWEHL